MVLEGAVLVDGLGSVAELFEPLIGSEGEATAPLLGVVERVLGLVALLEPIAPAPGLVALLEPIELELPALEPPAPSCANAAGANPATDNARPAPSRYVPNRLIEPIKLLLGRFAATR
jgi:hypothetical protein